MPRVLIGSGLDIFIHRDFNLNGKEIGMTLGHLKFNSF